jgi:Spy/CpxP family protein refolding chaperone
MKHFRILKQMAVIAGLLALCTLPATLRAQATPQNDSPGSAQAAPARHGAERNEGELAKLNLSDDQKAQVKKIHEDAKSQAEAVKNDSSLSDTQRQSKLRAIHESAHEQVKQLLTPEQREQMKADEKARRAERQPGQAPPQQ